MERRHVLVTGATGYVGGRLVPCLLQRGHRVRCFVRDAGRLQGRSWRGDVEVVEGDALDPDSLGPALDGIDAVYYLIHSMSVGERFAAQDRQAARNVGRACREAGVGRIIYLGGIQPKGEHVSEHLQSRLETGRLLREGGVPVTEFQAAVIVGSGSLSFELIRYLTERLPVMICPRWVQTPTQPIAVRSVLEYLVEALDVPESAGRVFEIGGEDVLTYGDMFRIYAKVRGLRRLVVNVPFLTPRLSSLWLGLVTPLSTAIARPLVKGLDNEVVVHDEAARRLFSVRPISYEAAVRLAVRRFTHDDVETIWHGAFSTSSAEGLVERLEDEEGLIREVRRIRVAATPEAAFEVVTSLGGQTGWMFANKLWEVRGLMDLLAGGVGLRRGRRDPDEVFEGEAVDFWRVEAVERPRLLRLRAEMKVPGKAWLQFVIEPEGDGTTCITQSALFEPKGLFGLLYWYVFYPAHKVLFPGMIREIGRRAEARTRAAQDADPPAT